MQTGKPVINYDEHWKEALDTYKNHPTSRHRRRYVMNAVRREPFPAGGFVFDYGCGGGIILGEVKAALGLRDDQLGGCDLAEEAIRIAERNFKSPHFYLGSYPEVARPIDLAICTEVIEHTTDYRLILEWLKAHLRPGGRLILTTPGGTMDPPDEYYGHVQHFKLGELAALMKEIGFEVRSARCWGFPLFSLQKIVTRRNFERVRDEFMGGPLSLKKKLIFTAAYYAYFIHDLIPHGPQIYIEARG